MPTEWQTHADSVQTAVSTTHDLDGSLKQIQLQLDVFRTREWPEDESEIKAAGQNPKHLNYDTRDEHYIEHGAGAHATVTYSVAADAKFADSTVVELSSITPEDGDEIAARHMALLPAAERIVTNLSDVDAVRDSLETFASAYHDAADVHIERLD